MNDGFVPRSVINRLPRYLQALNLMAKAGLHTVSSEFLAEQVGTNCRYREKLLNPFIADELVQAGIKAILNYTPARLKLPQMVFVEQINPVLILQQMFYYLKEE